jgi:hypothetical protein
MERASLASTVPEHIRSTTARVVEVGFGAGPGFAAISIKSCLPPITLEDALAYLERYRDVFKRGHITLSDGTLMWFLPDGFAGAR